MVIPDTNEGLAPPRTENTATKKTKGHLASPLDRLAAFVIDHLIVLGPIVNIFISVFERQMKEAILIGDDPGVLLGVANIAFMSLSIVVIYHTTFLRLVGASLGQVLMGLRVVEVWEQKPLGTWNSFLRVILWVSNFLLLGLPALAVFSDEQRRTWYDRATDSIVVTTRQHRSIAEPPLYQRSLVQGFLAALFVFSAFVVTLMVHTELGRMNRNAQILSILESEGVLCEAVGEAHSQWPEERGRTASRVSVAMGLYLSGEIDLSCLEAEFDPRAFANQQDAEARLAKSFIYSDHEELSDLYLSAVCDYSTQTDACWVAESVLKRKSQNDIKQGLPEEAALYSRLWLLSEQLDLGEYTSAEQTFQGLPNLPWLAGVRSPALAKILWGRADYEKARGAAEMAFELLGDANRVDLSAWFCREELKLNCEAWDSSSCSLFQSAVKEDQGYLEQTSLALTQLKKRECEQGDSMNYLSLLRDPFPAEVARLVEAKANGRRPHLLQMAQDKTLGVDVRSEALLHLLTHAPTETELLYAEEAFALGYLGRDRLSVAEHLMDWYMLQRDYEKVIAVAEAFEHQQIQPASSVLEALVIAEYHVGRQIKAKEILSRYQQMYPQNWVALFWKNDREPASVSEKQNEFLLIARNLQ